MTLSLSYDPSGGLGVDATDYLWNMYNEHVTQGRHHEAQRTGVTTVVLALAGAVTAFIAQGHLEHAWTLAAFLIALGVPVSYTHLRAHETRHDLVCRLLLEK